MAEETGDYQPLDTTTSPAVELQPAKTEAPTATVATPDEKKHEEKKVVPLRIDTESGYVRPKIPLRHFHPFAKLWAKLSFPILLVHLGICLIYITSSYSFVANAFDGAGLTLQYLISSTLLKNLIDCSNYTSSNVTMRALVAAQINCGTVLKYAEPMLEDFPAHRGPNVKLLALAAEGDVEFQPKFSTNTAQYMSPELCDVFSNVGAYDYDWYSYDYLLDGVGACVVANEIVPTSLQEWDGSRIKTVKAEEKKPKDRAIRMVYVYIFPMAAFVILMALYTYKYFLPWLQFVEPFNSKELISTLFRGHADGLFMASYQWNDHPTLSQKEMREPPNQKFQGVLPRKVATILPHSWLDIENLIPGTAIKPACNSAAKNAKFPFCFISEDYFKSANCGVEWVEIERRPGECFLFAYPSTPQDKLDALAAQGHKIYKVEEVFDKMGPEWLLEHLVSSRQANFLFSHKTPPINEGWLSTLRYYFPTPDLQWLKYSTPSLLTYTLLLAWHIGWSAEYSLFTLYKEGAVGTLGVFAFFIPLVGLAVTFYFMKKTYGTGFAHSNLPDICLLLYFLRKLDVIPCVKFYSNCLEQADPEVKTLAELDIIKFVDDILEADVRLVNIDKLDDLPPPRNSDAIWASVGFMQLPQTVRDRIGSFIVGEKIPSTQLEFIAVKILMAAFQCPSTDSLDVGSNSFRQLKLKRVLE